MRDLHVNFTLAGGPTALLEMSRFRLLEPGQSTSMSTFAADAA
jgi:hypothetical protein